MKDICWLRIEEGGVENVDFMSACADMFTSLYVFSTGYASRCFLLLCSCTAPTVLLLQPRQQVRSQARCLFSSLVCNLTWAGLAR